MITHYCIFTKEQLWTETTLSPTAHIPLWNNLLLYCSVSEVNKTALQKIGPLQWNHKTRQYYSWNVFFIFLENKEKTYTNYSLHKNLVFVVSCKAILGEAVTSDCVNIELSTWPDLPCPLLYYSTLRRMFNQNSQQVLIHTNKLHYHIFSKKVKGWYLFSELHAHSRVDALESYFLFISHLIIKNTSFSQQLFLTLDFATTFPCWPFFLAVQDPAGFVLVSPLF